MRPRQKHNANEKNLSVKEGKIKEPDSTLVVLNNRVTQCVTESTIRLATPLNITTC